MYLGLDVAILSTLRVLNAQVNVQWMCNWTGSNHVTNTVVVVLFEHTGTLV